MGMETVEMWDAMKDVKYRRTLEALRRIIQDAQGDLETAVTVALDMVATAIHAEAGTFWFYDRFGDGLIRPKAVYGGGKIGSLYLSPGEGVAGGVIESSKPAMIADCQKDPRWAGKVDSATGFCTRSMICVPLIAREAVFGCIQIINKLDGLPFDEKDLKFALRLAEAIAELFDSHGLLAGYQPSTSLGNGAKVSFAQVFGTASPREMEVILRSMAEFASLGVADQKQVLEHARQIREILGLYKQAEKSEKTHRRFGFK